MLNIQNIGLNKDAVNNCNSFVNSNEPKYILGRNVRAEAVGKIVDVDGFVDDYTDEKEYLGKPILRSYQLPENSIVLITSICNPFSAEKSLINAGVTSIDYFSFLKYSGLDIPDIQYQEGFSDEFEKNKSKYESIYEILSDVESRNQFENILNFRLNLDLRFMRGFTNREKEQYFEDFLKLSNSGEVFVDVGGYDGYTAVEFIKRCPGYKAVHLFEPELINLKVAKENLKNYKYIYYYPLGLYSEKTSFSFSSGGSASRISKKGEIKIDVDALDHLVNDTVTFIKMDIEGSEIEAIKGAKGIIEKYKPRLAISVYHRPDDFWKIPETVFSIRNDYKVYLRHYMEGITETVMFFV